MSQVTAGTAPGKPGGKRFAVLAVGCKAGVVWLWRYWLPQQPTPSGSANPNSFDLVSHLQTMHSLPCMKKLYIVIAFLFVLVVWTLYDRDD